MTEEPEQTQLQLQTPGEILKEEREKRDLSVEDVAKSLNLKIDIIHALESDQYDKLAAPTYTKGYLRSYAKAVDVDAESLIKLFDSTQENPDTPEILPKVSTPTQVSSNDKPVKIVTYLVTLGTALLLLIWWKGDTVMLPGGGDSSDSHVVQPSPSGAFDYEFQVIEHPDDPFFRAETHASDYEATPVTAETDPESNELIGAISELPQASELSQPNLTGDGTNTETDSGSGDLTLLIQQESWIEIHDANNKRLYLDLAKPGKIINVSGPTPYSILLGNAHGVRIQFKGEDFDLAPHIRSGVARLKLGE